MDPNAALEVILENIRSGEGEGARDSAHDLAEWIQRGGFEPDWMQVISDFLPVAFGAEGDLQ